MVIRCVCACVCVRVMHMGEYAEYVCFSAQLCVYVRVVYRSRFHPTMRQAHTLNKKLINCINGLTANTSMHGYLVITGKVDSLCETSYG